jgi:uncharacterized membrane protein
MPTENGEMRSHLSARVKYDAIYFYAVLSFDGLFVFVVLFSHREDIFLIFLGCVVFYVVSSLTLLAGAATKKIIVHCSARGGDDVFR